MAAVSPMTHYSPLVSKKVIRINVTNGRTRKLKTSTKQSPTPQTLTCVDNNFVNLKQLSFTFNYSHSIDQLLYHSTRLNIREVGLNRSIGPALIVSVRCTSGGRGLT